MAKYVCTLCGYVYDEDKGIPESGIAPGTRFEDLPDDWTCPMCGSPKSMFKKIEEVPAPSEPVSAGPVKDAVSIPAGEGGDRMREMSFAEMADLCSNLQRGCEKQYLTEEAGLFGEISDYYRKRAEPASDLTDERLLALINEGLAAYDSADAAAGAAGDRGAKRAMLWSTKVARILQALVERLGKEGEGFLENTGVWVCDICGFIYVGNDPPEICPVCKVPRDKLVKIERRQI
ncbi:MAG: rubredoxin [Methanomethylophilus alvi]|nr:MAG: rubredoxin [Methanomethylophilus alvi]